MERWTDRQTDAQSQPLYRMRPVDVANVSIQYIPVHVESRNVEGGFFPSGPVVVEVVRRVALRSHRTAVHTVICPPHTRPRQYSTASSTISKTPTQRKRPDRSRSRPFFNTSRLPSTQIWNRLPVWKPIVTDKHFARHYTFSVLTAIFQVNLG